jgi:YVTN family beta-propeller protein
MTILLRALCVLALTLTIGGCVSLADTSPTLLFNGEDLDGWYTFLRERGRDSDPNGVFTIADGVLRISGEEWGCITSTEEYADFHLVVEYRWGEKTWGDRADKTRDSGVLVHSQGEDGGYSGIWMHSIEAQIIEGGTGDFIVVGDGTDTFSITSPLKWTDPEKPAVFKNDGTLVTKTKGRVDWFARDAGWSDTLGFRGERDLEKPVGEWNRLEVICDGDTITNKLNGVIVNQAFKVRPTSGRIQIQSEGAELFVRRVDLLPVTPKPGPGPNKRRFIYNSDGNNMYIHKDYPMSPEEVYTYVDELVGNQVTTLFLSPNYGMPVAYPTKVGDFIGEHASPELAKEIHPDAPPVSHGRGIMNMRAVLEAGYDPFGLVIDRARAQGLETFVSWRLNEVHAVEKEDSLIFSRFWKEHPEWRIGKAGDPLSFPYRDILGINTSPIVGTWLPGGLNFAVPEVRAHRLAQLRECMERFNQDGLELDFQRFPMYFKPGEEAQHIETMTQFVRDIRAMTNEIGAARGRPIELCARIMARPDQNQAIGLDPVAWAHEGLIDFVVVSHYLRNDYPLPIQDYRALLPEGMPIYASLEYATRKNAYRHMARQVWENGADGPYLFNFFASRENSKEPLNGLLNEIGDPETIPVAELPEGKPLLMVANKHSDSLSYVDPETLQVLDTIATGHNPHEMTITPDQRIMYLSNYAPPGNTISVVDIPGRKHIKQIPTGEYTRIHGATMAPDGKHAYFTAGQTGYAVEVDTTTHEVSRGIPTHGEISHMVLVSPDNKYLYTANIVTENVSVIDRASGELVTKIPCAQGAEGMAFTPDGKHLWVGNQSGGSITIIDVATHTPIKTFDCPGMPVRLKFINDGKRVLIPSWTEEGQLIVIDTDTLKEVKRIRVGGYAIGVEVTPDEKRAFVGCEHNDGLHVINLDTLEVEAVVHTGDGPDPMLMWYPPKDD